MPLTTTLAQSINLIFFHRRNAFTFIGLRSSQSWESGSGGVRRNPHRSTRPVDGALAAPEIVPDSFLGSDVSNEPTKKKKKAIKNDSRSNTGSSDFEPTIYFPTKEVCFFRKPAVL